MAFLLIPDKKQTRKVQITKNPFFIGRARENDLIIHSDAFSRFHAQINRKDADYIILDRGSLNGVFVNGARIHAETVLHNGDIIGFGDFHVRFLVEEGKPLRTDTKELEKMQRFPVEKLMDSRRLEPARKQLYLDLLYTFSSRLLQHSPSSDLGEVALDLAQEVWSPDRSCLMLREASGNWQIATQRFGKNPQLTGDTLEISSNLIRELEKNEEALLIANRQQDERFVASESLQRQNVNSALCAPLLNNSKIYGFLYADLIYPNRSFNYVDLQMFTILANLMAIKWENDQLWHQVLVQQQLEQELNLAAEIQRKFFPTRPPDLDGYDVAGLSIPTRKVGGDAYFWHERKDGKVVFMIADVMGKGLPSSLLMSQIQAIMKIFSEQFADAQEIVTAVNEFIYKFSTQERFISMFVMMLTPETGKMTYCNAGHNPPFLLKRESDYDLLEKGGMLMGVFSTQHYNQGEAILEPADMLVMYTDGLIEARNSTDEEFGIENLVQTVRSSETFSVELLNAEIIQKIREEWLATDQEDDWTILTVKRL
jgi:phosphoserine phosphatase RsbU/P